MAAKQWIISIAVASLLSTSIYSGQASAASSAPYESYNYNFYEEAVASPAPYLPARSISGADLGIGDFLEPSDMYVTSDEVAYILDSGNHRIVIVDNKWHLIKVISSFNNGGKSDGFNNPSGIFVDHDNRIYVADTDNQRVVVLTQDGELVKLLENPKSDILADNFKFVPLKVTVDKANRIFVVSRGIYEGIIQFDTNGEFIGYVGTNKIQRNFVDYVWRLLSTEEQKKQMMLYVPTEFSNLDIDRKGFVFATNIDPDSKEPIKRLNPSGGDVLKRFGYFDVKGDIRYRLSLGPSKMVDIKVLEGGMYAALDSVRGRVFTYNDEGDLLYVFGGKGNQLGTFKSPVAIETMGDSRIVLDRGKGNVVVFEPTAFGTQVNKATGLHYNGDDSEAVNVWKEVLRLNSNYDIAYIGIGKSLLIEKKNEEASGYFKLGMERKDYSVAYKRYRKEVLKQYFGVALSTIMILILLYFLYKLVKSTKVRRDRRRETGFY